MSKFQYVQKIGNATILNDLKGTPFEFDHPSITKLQGNSYIYILAYIGDQCVGRIAAGIYSSKTLARVSQWEFVANKHRNCWIDDLRVSEKYQKQGIGSELLRRVEDFFSSNRSNYEKKFPKFKRNVYVVSTFPSVPFYKKNGYYMIKTSDHDDDEDFPEVYAAEVGQWMAKPFFKGPLDREKIQKHLAIEDSDSD